MVATKLGVLFVLLLYIVKLHLVIAQAIPSTCGGACTGYGFCGGVYPTVFDTSNTDPLDILLPVLLLAMCKKMGAAAAEEAAASNKPAPSGADASGCACCSGCVPQCCQACSQCGSPNSAGCPCVCGSGANKPNACAGCCPDTSSPPSCGCPNPCGGCMCC